MKKNRVVKSMIGALCTATVFVNAMPTTLAAEEVRGEWVEENGNKYWYENGVRQGTEGRGKEIYDPASDGWYWLDAVDDGKMATGKDVYQESWAGPYADREDGTGKWCRYDENGKMVKGWDVTDEGTYYFDLTTGAMAKGETVIDEKSCVFDLTTGVGLDCQWYEIDGVKYWYEGGVRQGTEGRGKEIYDPASDAWYWLDAVDGGKMATGKDVYQESDGGKWVRYDAEGHMIKGWHEQNGNRYFFDYVTGAMAKGTVEIDGIPYRFDETTGIYQGIGHISYGVGVAYHTQDEVQSYMANSGVSDSDIRGVTTMASEPNLTAPYEKGTVSTADLDKALAMLNQVRYIAGLDYHVTLNNDYTEMAQAGAFLDAVNHQLSHYPSRPAGMSDELYDLGYEGASSSNLAWTSWSSSLPRSILSWMDDSDTSNIDRVGHRRWILNPTMGETGFGYAADGNGGAYSSLYVFDRVWGETDVRGVTWPAQEMPVSYFDEHTAWSYSYGEALSDISVKLTRISGGSREEWNFSENAGDGFFNVQNSNYGQKGCVIFRPEGITIRAGESYLVTIKQGEDVLANYTVNFF